MSNTRIMISALILGVSIVGCASDAAPTGSDDSKKKKKKKPTPDPATTPTPDPVATPAPDPTTTPTPAPDPGTTANPDPVPPSAATCTAGGLLCCNAVLSANTPAVSALLGLLGVRGDLLTEPVGLSCSSTPTVASCNRIATCCT